MRKNYFQIFLTALLALFSYQAVSGQNANISYEVRVNGSGVQSTEGSIFSGSSCAEGGNEEYTANVRIDGPTVGTNVCMTCDNNGNCNYGGGTLLRSSTNVSTTGFTVVYDIFEDDGGARCNFDGGDDCRAASSYFIDMVSTYPPTFSNSYSNFTNNQVYNNSSTHNILLDNSWRYSGTASLIIPTCAVQNAAYGAGAIRSWSVNLTAGVTYNFNTCSSPSNDTYLRIYGPDGFTLVIGGDDNCGVLSNVNYTAASTGTYYVEVSQFSRGALTAAGTLSYSIVPKVGSTFGNPIAVGTLGCGLYSNTQNNTVNTGFCNDFGQASDDIYYTFTLSSPGTVNIYHCGSGFDTYIYLLDNLGGVIASNDDNGVLCGGTAASLQQGLPAGTYYVVSEGYSSNSGNITTQIQIQPANNPGVITAPAAICLNSAASITNVTAATGASAFDVPSYYYYYQRTSAPATGWVMYDGPTSNLSSALPVAVTGTAGTYLLARNSAFPCAGQVSAPFLNLTVDAPSTLGTVSNPGPINFCDAGGNFTTAVTVSGQTGSITWDWGSNNGVWNGWVSGASSGVCCFPKKTSNSDGNADRIRYRVTNGTCAAVTSGTILIQNRFNEAPSSLGSSSSTYCANAAPATITLTATFPTTINMNGIVSFYSGSCGGTLVGSVSAAALSSTAAVTIAAPAATTTYFARYEPGAGTGCSNSTCVQTTVTVNTLSVAPASISGTTTICNGASTTLTQTGGSLGTGAVYNWYTGSCGGTLIGTGNSITVSPTINTTYFVRAQGTCNATACASVIVSMESTPPTISCPANISVNNTVNTCGAVVTYTAPIGTDNCPGATTAQIAGLPSGATYPVGVTTNTFRVTDGVGLISTCSFTVTVVDNQLPVISCPANISVNNTVNTCGAVVTYTAPIGTDNCPGATTVQITGLASGATYPVGVTTNTFRVTDASGNQTTCSFTVTVNDAQLPAISCPANISVNNAINTCGAVVTYTAPIGTDNCPGATTVQITGLASGATYPVGVTTNTFRVTDASGNQTTCSFTVTVNDAQLPAISCPANISVNNAINTCGAVVTYTAPIGTDNCPGATTAQIAGLASGATYPVGVTTNTFRVTDASGNQTTCSFTVTVNDAQLPAITCPANITVGNTPGFCSAVVTYTAPIGTDNCPGATTSQIAGLASGATYPVGVTTNTFRVTDGSGNQTTCSFTVTVNDTQAPTVTSPSTVDLECASDLPPAVTTIAGFIGLPGASASDNCTATGSLTISSSTGSLVGTSCNGTITRTYTITDAALNSTNVNHVFTITDNTAPVINCPANITQNAVPLNCGKVVTYSIPTATDNCSSVTITQTDGTGYTSGQLFPVGVTTLTYTATDVCGNSSSCSFSITIIDNQNPIITSCPSNVTVSNATGMCNGVVNWIAPTASDNCPGVTMTSNFAPGSTFPVGTTAVIYTATDASLNTALCSFNVTVNDTELPTIVCSGAVSVNNDAGACTATVTLTTPTTNDNCGVATVTNNHPSTTYPVGTTTVTWTVTDIHGNTNTCTQDVIVADSELPTIVCSGGVSVNNDAGACTATVTLTTPATNDNCGVATVINNHPSTTYPVGTTTVIWTVTDIHGNSNTCMQNVIVTDTELPTIVCSGAVSVNNDAGSCSAVVTLTTPITNDNCGVATVSNNHPSTTYPVGTTTVTWTVTDLHGNVNSCAQNVTVTDNELPTIACAGTITVNNDAGACTAIVILTTPTTNDNCGVATVSNNHPSTTYPVGTTTVIWTVTDVHGNTNTCTQDVIVADSELPTIVCSGGVSVNNDAGACTATVTLTTPATNDNCGVATVINNHPSTTYPVGTTTVIWTVTDIHGNSNTCMQNVIVTDSELPTIVCSGAVSVNNDAGSCSAVVTLITPTTNDNCGVATVSNNHPSTTYPVGTTTVTWTVTDVHGNTNTCIQGVTVTDNELPSVACSGPVLVNNDPGLCSADVNLTAPTGGDNCGVLSIISNHPSTTYPVGTTTVTWTVTDVHGNTNTCTQNVIVTDAELPTIACSGTVSVNNDAGACAATITLIAPATNDNCGVLGISNNHPSTTYPVGTTAVIWTVTDIHGNTNTCTQSVIVTDTEAPVAPVIANAVGECSVVVTSPTATDNCSGTIVGSTTSPLSYNVQGTYLITWTFMDGNGNSSTATQTVIIDDITAPVPNTPVLATVNGVCSVTVFAPAATDNCVGNVTATPASATYSNGGTFVQTWTYDDGNGNVSTQTQTVVVSSPEADIFGNGVGIIHQSSAYAAANNTDFGSTTVCNGTITKTYVIQNNGIGTLNLTGSPLVKITGLNPGDFTVISMPATSIPQGGSTSFSIRFNPSGTGARYARVTVNNDDCNESGYYYQIRGTGSGTDNVAPVPNLASLPVITGSCNAIVSTIPTATDACAGLITGTTTSALTYSAQGSYTVIWSYNDGNGNTSTQTQMVLVQDLTPPTANCQPVVLELNTSGNITLNAGMINNGSFDNCGPLTFIGIMGAVKVVNGTFTGSLSPWTTSNGTTYMSTGGNPGGFAWMNGSNSATSDPSVQQTYSDLIPGATYVVRGDYKTVSGTGTPGQVAFGIDLDGTQIATKGLPNPITSWTPFTVTFTATSSSHTLRFRGEINGTDGDIALDNIRIDGTAKNYNCFTRGVNNITLVVMDGYGNTASCNTTATIQSTVNPCPFSLPIDPSGVEEQVNNNEGNNEEGGNTSSIENNNNFGGRIYPNPSNGIFNLELSTAPRGKTELRVLDQLGQVLYVTQLTSQTSYFDLSYLRSATYYIQVISEEGSFTKTIIVTQQY